MTAVAEPALRSLYDAETSRFLGEGIDFDRFYGNPSYFKTDEQGHRTELAGHHPTVAHFPIVEYPGGAGLAGALAGEVERVEALLSPGDARWIARDSWHSTVFSHVHGSDPEVIAAAEARFDPLGVSQELSATEAYHLTFTRVLVTSWGALIAVAHPSGGELADLRRRLEAICPGSKSGKLVHLTLGQLVSPPSPSGLAALRDYVRSFASDEIVLGRIRVDFLTLAEYRAPFLSMTMREISRHRLAEPTAAPPPG